MTKLFQGLPEELREKIKHDFFIAGFTFCDGCGERCHHRNLTKREVPGRGFPDWICGECKERAEHPSHLIDC